MATATVEKRRRKEVVGPEANGRLMTPAQFDRAEFDDDWRYELINGVLIVSPLPSVMEADPNEELGRWIRNYQEFDQRGSVVDITLAERIIRIGANRRRPDRIIWIGLGRMPRRGDKPGVIVEFVSSRKRDRERDYETKRDEYMSIPVKQYWIIDRFERVMVVFTRQGGRIKKQVIAASQVFKTDLLPGFELPLAKLLAVADRWEAVNKSDAI